MLVPSDLLGLVLMARTHQPLPAPRLQADRRAPNARRSLLLSLPQALSGLAHGHLGLESLVMGLANDSGRRDDGLSTDEHKELTLLRRENKRLKLEAEILSQAAAWFARERSWLWRSDCSANARARTIHVNCLFSAPL